MYLSFTYFSLLTHTKQLSLVTFCELEKHESVTDQGQRPWTDGRMDGRKDRQT